jgi:inhibitor of KinA
VQRLALAVHEAHSQWVRDVVPALGGLALHFDPSFEGNVPDAAAELVTRCIKEGLPSSKSVGREVEVPVCYDIEFGFDLAELAQKLKMAPEEIARRHAAGTYRVLMVGFAPGHPYMSGLDPALAVPRRATPRAVVPAGSVAIANEQAVIYPYAISGGWSVVGRTPLQVFNAHRPEPSLLQAGDRVRFRPIPREDFGNWA